MNVALDIREEGEFISQDTLQTVTSKELISLVPKRRRTASAVRKSSRKNPETTVSKSQVALATLVEVINDKRYFDQSNQGRKAGRTPHKVKESDVQRVTTQYIENREIVF